MGSMTLRFNEVPSWHLILTLDGETIEPKSFISHINIQLSKCEKLLLMDFESVDFEVPDIYFKILNKGQQYLLHIISAIKSGNFPVDLSLPEAHPPSH